MLSAHRRNIRYTSSSTFEFTAKMSKSLLTIKIIQFWDNNFWIKKQFLNYTSNEKLFNTKVAWSQGRQSMAYQFLCVCVCVCVKEFRNFQSHLYFFFLIGSYIFFITNQKDIIAPSKKSIKLHWCESSCVINIILAVVFQITTDNLRGLQSTRLTDRTLK